MCALKHHCKQTCSVVNCETQPKTRMFGWCNITTLWQRKRLKSSEYFTHSKIPIHKLRQRHQMNKFYTQQTMKKQELKTHLFRIKIIKIRFAIIVENITLQIRSCANTSFIKEKTKSTWSHRIQLIRVLLVSISKHKIAQRWTMQTTCESKDDRCWSFLIRPEPIVFIKEFSSDVKREQQQQQQQYTLMTHTVQQYWQNFFESFFEKKQSWNLQHQKVWKWRTTQRVIEMFNRDKKWKF